MMDVPRPYSIGNDDFIIFVAILLFALFGYTWYRSKGMIAHKVNCLFSQRKASGGENFQDSGDEILNYCLFIFVSAMSLGLLLFNRITLFAFQFDSVQAIIYTIIFCLAGMVCVYVAVKLVLYNLINWLFFNKESNTHWASDYVFITSMLAFVLFPIAMLKVFFHLDDKVIGVMLLITFILYGVLLFLKSCINFQPKINGYLLLFLYLCTLEILPVLFLWHFMT